MALSKKRALLHRLVYAVGSRRRRASGQPFRPVGIFKVDRLGDFVLALGAIHAVVREYGPERCVLIVSPHAQELARREFPGVEVLVIEMHFGKLEEGARYLRSLRHHPLFQRGVDRLLCLRHHRTPYIDLALAGIPSRELTGMVAGRWSNFEGEWFGSKLALDRTVPTTVAGDGECEELTAHRALVGAFIGKTLAAGALLPRLQAVNRRPRERHLLVAPFCGTATRDLSLNFLQETLRQVQAARPIPVRLVASPADAPRMHALARGLAEAGVRDVSTVVTAKLEELLTEMVAATACLLPETATAHLACALECDMVSLLGGGHHGTFAPWGHGDRQRWVIHRMDCFRCNWQCCHPEAYCLTRISPTTVAGEVISLLALPAAVERP